MKKENHRLEFLPAFFFLLAFLLIVAVFIFGLSLLSQTRKDFIYQTYASETSQYIYQNRPQLITLFNEVFPKEDCIAKKEQNDICAFPSQDVIARLLAPTLKDWSSTVFVKEEGEKILMMRLSGDVTKFSIYPEQKRLQLQKLLRGETEKIDWDDYTRELTGKEVVIAVKDSNGKIIGAIMRSVIEVQ